MTLREDLQELLDSMIRLSSDETIHPSARAAYDDDAIALRGILYKHREKEPTP